MSRLRKLTPSYIRYRRSGRASACWTDSLGVRHFRMLPDPFGSKESRDAHDKLCLELAASPTGACADPKGISVVELLDAYRAYAKRIYRHPETGKTTEELRQ